ncbi:MAG TPA: hypothetical protein VK947_10550 [Planococcus sp. (in: firmicutes)]|nr:hypothetical protein [Planococcus sp. (in: firmicutes)]
MKISALNISLAALAFGLVFMPHFEPGPFAEDTANKDEPGREVIELVAPRDDKLIEELKKLELQVESKSSLTLAEYHLVQGQLDELLQRVNEEAKASGEADAELFGEILELQEVVVGIDVR